MVNFREIVKKLTPDKLFSRIEPFGHLIESILANIYYGFPARKMHFIGVTGTNGKTTTTFMIHRMLHEAGYKVAFTSTVAYGIGDDITYRTEHITTSPAHILQKQLRDFSKAGMEWVVVETSSHSLAQNRVWGLPYEIAVMTNVTNDHLDYHKTFDRYLESKARLFKIANKHGMRFGVVNADDKNHGKFVDSIAHSLTYGIKSGKLRAKNIKLMADGSKYQVKHGGVEYNINIKLPGDFNISNSLAALTVGYRLGLTSQQIEKGLAALDMVEGRMMPIEAGQPFKILIDFASTPDAFERLLSNLRPITKGKLVAVFGSAGRRDEAKRYTQGEIAGKFADEVVLTEEDDRDVDGNGILAQIAEGAARSGKVKDKDMFLILDRPEAIKFALTRVKNANDLVVFMGKGHERTIERNHGEDYWNEAEEVKKALKLQIK